MRSGRLPFPGALERKPPGPSPTFIGEDPSGPLHRHFNADGFASSYRWKHSRFPRRLSCRCSPEPTVPLMIAAVVGPIEPATFPLDELAVPGVDEQSRATHKPPNPRLRRRSWTSSGVAYPGSTRFAE